jgi:hypothetical protein
MKEMRKNRKSVFDDLGMLLTSVAMGFIWGVASLVDLVRRRGVKG